MVFTFIWTYIAQIPGKSSQGRGKVIISHCALFALLTTLVIGSLQIFPFQLQAHAASSQVACSWYKIRPGDTLSGIAIVVHTDFRALARANRIHNINLIFAGQQLCISKGTRGSFHRGAAPLATGIESNGNVRWYAYNALEWSTNHEVKTLLYSAAAFYGLPANLLLAIAWQESGWQQHVISRDGGIGMMQIMPFTATWLNSITGLHRDPYKLKDNIFMGAYYVRYLCTAFHWNIQQMVSAYNEGEWAVTHNGIMNWPYVTTVIDLSHNLR
jgi:hypothetical protein